MRTNTQIIISTSAMACSQGMSSCSAPTSAEDNQESNRIYVRDSFCFAEDLHSLPISLYAMFSAVLAILGSLALMPLWRAMGCIWATDPLRSIGAVFPLVACVGVLVAWGRLGWERRGTYWALPLVVLSILLVRAIDSSSLIVSYDGLQILNYGTALFLYACGAVLLFGGRRLLRDSVFPLCLLLMINPAPAAFNAMADLPLQHLSALTARSFAHLIGVQPTGAQLRMMFAPDFGMFIAPGCNGVRGSIVLFYLALIFGYAHRLRLHALVLTALGALIFGYALNLLRLCVLVVYYRIGIDFPAIQKYGTGIDYAIGCTLFLFAALGLGILIRSLKPSGSLDTQRARRKFAIEGPRAIRPAVTSRGALVRAVCFLILTFVFIVQELSSGHAQYRAWPTEQSVLSTFPSTVGPYRLTRTWTENSGNGTINLAMAEYVAWTDSEKMASRFTLGLWISSANHLVSDSKLIQGILAQKTGFFDATDQQAMPVRFFTSFYNDGILRQYDAESICRRNGCSGRPSTLNHDGIFFVVSDLSAISSATHGKSLPILLRREWPTNIPTSSEDLRRQFDADAVYFMSHIDLRTLLDLNGS